MNFRNSSAPRVLVAATLATALLGACDTPERRQEQSGTVIGAVVGGLLGSQVGQGSGRAAAAAIGAAVGAVVGGSIGRSMDANDRQRFAQALETSPSGVASRWVNPDTGTEYTVVPMQPRASAQGPCRDYTVDAVVDGRPEKITGHACRQADGSWHTAG